MKWRAIVFTATSIVSAAPAHGEAPISDCSLACANLHASETLNVADGLDPEVVRSVNRKLDVNAQGKTAMAFTLGTLKFAAGAYLDTLPGAGRGSDIVFDEIIKYDQQEFLNKSFAIIDGELAESVMSGKDISGFGADAKSVVDGLIGPTSKFGAVVSRTDYDALQDTAIKHLAARIVDISKAQAASLTQLRALGQQAQNQAQGLRDLHKRTVALKAEIDGLRKAEKDALAKPKTGDTPAPERAEETAVSARQYGQAARTFASQASAAASIMQDLGMPIAPDVAKGAAVVDIAGQLLMSGGNPLAVLPAIAGVSKLFGRKKEDGTAAILKQVQLVRQDIAKLRQEVREYHQLQMAEHSKTQLGIVGLLAVLEQQQTQRIQRCRNIIPNPEEYGLGTDVPLPAVELAWASPDPRIASPILNARMLRPRTWAEAKLFFANNEPEIRACHDALNTLFPSLGESNEAFTISEVVRLVDQGKTELPISAKKMGDTYYSRYVNSVRTLELLDLLEPIVSRGRKLKLGSETVNVLLWSASKPSGTTRELSAKAGKIDQLIELLINGLPNDKAASTRVQFFQHWAAERPLDVDLVNRAASTMLLAAWWWEMYDSNGFMPIGRMNRLGSLKSLDPLRRTNDTLRIGITQQALLSGDILLPLALLSMTGVPFDVQDEKALDGASFLEVASGNSDWWDKKATHDFDLIAKKNPLFASNLGFHFVERQISKGGSLTLYRFASARTTDDKPLRDVLGPPPSHGYAEARYHHDGKRWTIVRASAGVEYSIPLPSPEEVVRGELLITDQLRLAGELQRQLAQESVLYEMAIAPNPDADAYRVAAMGMIYQ